MFIHGSGMIYIKRDKLLKPITPGAVDQRLLLWGWEEEPFYELGNHNRPIDSEKKFSTFKQNDRNLLFKPKLAATQSILKIFMSRFFGIFKVLIESLYLSKANFLDYLPLIKNYIYEKIR